jgi:hypothetical protein
MSVETKKPRKAPAKKATEATVEKKAKAAPRAKGAKTAVVKVAAATAPSNLREWPSHEEIALLAHRYYEERGWQDGFHEQDWFKAERDLLAAS